MSELFSESGGGGGSSEAAMDVLATVFVVFVLIAAAGALLVGGFVVAEERRYVRITGEVQGEPVDARPLVFVVVEGPGGGRARAFSSGTSSKLREVFGASDVDVLVASRPDASLISTSVTRPREGRYRALLRLDRDARPGFVGRICLEARYPLQQEKEFRRCSAWDPSSAATDLLVLPLDLHFRTP